MLFGSRKPFQRQCRGANFSALNFDCAFCILEPQHPLLRGGDGLTRGEISRPRPRLLVSVRNAEEALAAAHGGADVIDVKEPDRGSLGRADDDVIATICRALRDETDFAGPVSAALGELRDLSSLDGLMDLVPSLRWVKVGLSGCRDAPWTATWHQWQDRIVQGGGDCRLIGVAYVDWATCQAPAVDDVLTGTDTKRTPGVLFDTYEKQGKWLGDYFPVDRLSWWIRELRAQGRFVALAGGIDRQRLGTLMPVMPDVVAVRTAVCTGGRNGRVDADRVAAFRAALREEWERWATGRGEGGL
jgi:uncharacterized protein (UPF0264 family)